MKRAVRRRIALAAVVVAVSLPLAFVLVVIPVGASFLITNSRLSRGPIATGPLPFPVEEIEFRSPDGVRLRGWWGPHDEGRRSVIVFVHGLSRSRLEMLDRARDFYDLGYATFLFDLRNHGESGDAATTLAVREADDVCSAASYARTLNGSAPVVLWGVSLGAASALLATPCAEPAAVIAESSFLSLDETVRHHFSEIFHLPSFPSADLLLWLTRRRVGIAPTEGDVEGVVRGIDVPVLFVAGGADWRMPPPIAERLLAASPHPASQMLTIESATHGHAWEEDTALYRDRVRSFLLDVGAGPSSPTPTLY